MPYERPLVADLTRDPREDEPWFLALPLAVQEQTRAVWRARREQPSVWARRNRDELRRVVRQSALLLAFAVLFTGNWYPWTRVVWLALAGAFAGAVIGAVIQRAGCGRGTAAALAGVAAVPVQTYAGGALFGYAVISAVFAAVLFMVYGVRREFRTIVGGE